MKRNTKRKATARDPEVIHARIAKRERADLRRRVAVEKDIVRLTKELDRAMRRSDGSRAELMMNMARDRAMTVVQVGQYAALESEKRDLERRVDELRAEVEVLRAAPVPAGV